MLTREFCRIEQPADTQKTSGRRRQDFPKKLEYKSKKTETIKVYYAK